VFSLSLRAFQTRRFVAYALVAASTAALAACDQVTAPIKEFLSPATAAHLLNPSGNVVVTPDSMRGWSFFDDQLNVPCTAPSACHLVAGPSGQPLGIGSAELATPLAADGNALILADYNGIRFDHITSLHYSTFRQSVDQGNNLAIALQFNVDFDLTDGATGYQGRLVFEPYRTAGGALPRNTWQDWDAKAGKWWGTKTSVSRGGVLVSNPCVQSSPCTWAQLLSSFPNLGVHATLGAVVLKAGSNWAGFRGNVDKLSIGIDGLTTTFDFEPAQYHMRASIGTGLISTGWPRDTMYAAGTTLSYSFSARTGRDTPLVVLDDTLAALSGEILMDRNHTLEAVSDTSYTYAKLLPLEKNFADLNSQLLVASNKVAAFQALIDFSLTEIANGTSPQVISDAEALAQFVIVDPVRDAAALATIDDALGGHDFYVGWNADGSFFTYNRSGPPSPPAPPDGGGDPTFRGTAGSGLRVTRIGAQSGASSKLGVKSWWDRQRSTAHVIRPRAARAAFMSPRLSSASADAIADPENPSEMTEIVYTNGVFNDYIDANKALAVLSGRVRDIPRFTPATTTVTLHYNRTHSVEMTEYDRDHPCVAPTASWLRLLSEVGAVAKYAGCKGVRFVRSITSADIVESATIRAQLALHLPSTNPDVDSLSRLIKAYRLNDAHVLLVGHSEGTLVDAQAVQRLPAIEGHALQMANRCVAAIALAPPGDRATYDLDDNHLAGFLARNDIIHITLPTGWGADIDFPGARDADSAVAASSFPLLTKFKTAYEIHSVITTYLTGEISDQVFAQLAELHRECVMGSAEITLSASTVAVGSTVTATVDVRNQHNRTLQGRKVTFGSNGFVMEQIGASTFRAMLPRSAQDISANVDSRLFPQTQVQIPLVVVAGASFWEEDYDGGWDVVLSSNGDQNSPPPTTPPTGHWDGDEGSCRTVIHEMSTGTAFEDWQLRFCGRTYHVSGAPDTLVSGRHVDVTPIWRDASGSQVGSGCDEHHCIVSLQVELHDDSGELVGSSPLIPVSSGSTSRSPMKPTLFQPNRVPASHPPFSRPGVRPQTPPAIDASSQPPHQRRGP
jgi:hypothetical protein